MGSLTVAEATARLSATGWTMRNIFLVCLLLLLASVRPDKTVCDVDCAGSGSDRLCSPHCYSTTDKTIVESVKHKSYMMNTLIEGFFIGFTCFCIGYAVMVTVNNCRQDKGQYACKQ